MIIINKVEDGFLTYSDSGLKIKPVYDRLNREINKEALYDDAFDIEVEGKPRFEYEETDIKREVIENEESINKSMEQ